MISEQARPDTEASPAPGAAPDGDAEDHVLQRVRVRRRRRRRQSWVKRHPALAVLAGLALLLLVVLLLWLWWLNDRLDDVRRFPLDVDHRVERVAGDQVNLLLLGVDDLDGLREVGPNVYDMLESGDWEPGTARSDTMMVLHLDSGRESAQLVSVPRDSWVEVPGHGRNKINAAFSLGGPSLAVETVEENFGIYIDHVVVVDFDGFKDISEVVGGVNVFVEETVTDSMRDKTWDRGYHHLEGENALEYVRMRYGLARGDYERIERQQNFLRALLDKLTDRGTLLNPVKVSRLASDLSELVSVDEGLTNDKLRDLALSSRNLRSHAVRFLTVPNTGTGTTSGGASIVELDARAARSMFEAIERDEFEIWFAKNQVSQLPDREGVG